MTARSTGLPLSFDVVSIQSQVVYGRVGNNVAAPTLTAAGLRVAAVPTVVYSNTPHYPSWHGGALPADWLEGYLSDLQARGALRTLRAVLVGYLGSVAQADVLVRWIRALREQRPELLVVVDPVLGDHDHGLYVDAGLVPAYRDRLLPLASVATPNGFELQALSGQRLASVDEAAAAARTLLRGHLQWMAVTSAVPLGQAAAVPMAVVEQDTWHRVQQPRVDIDPKGTGDLFAAALTAHLLNRMSPHQAVARAGDQVIAALHATRDAGSAELVLPQSFH